VSESRKAEKYENGFLTVAEVAEIINVSTAWVYRKAKAGLIPNVRVGGIVRFRKDVFSEWLSTHSRGDAKI
jgi:excisionase family DNA binding protein